MEYLTFGFGFPKDQMFFTNSAIFLEKKKINGNIVGNIKPHLEHKDFFYLCNKRIVKCDFLDFFFLNSKRANKTWALLWGC